jgi:hypothetical protein
MRSRPQEPQRDVSGDPLAWALIALMIAVVVWGLS